MTAPKPAYSRILLKLSGESLLGPKPYGIDFGTTSSIAKEIGEVHALGVQVAVMIGGGNIFRGQDGTAVGLERVSADQMGLLATVINGIALQDALEKQGVFTRHVSALEIRAVAEPFVRRRVVRHLEKGRVVVFAGGTGNPYFTTDTAAALRAAEVGAEVVLKATKVDGVYEADPVRHPEARLFTELRYREVLERDLRVMDATAITMCLENQLPIRVFNISVPGNIARAVRGEPVGTLVH